jgi:hypothetical protein
MSTFGFCAFSATLACFSILMASLGQAKLQIWQPTQRFLSRVNL